MGLAGCVDDAVAQRESGVVNHDVDMAKATERLSNMCRDYVKVGEVERNQADLLRPTLAGNLRESIRPATRQDEAGASGGEGEGEGATDTGGGAGDPDHFAYKRTV